MVRKKVLRKDKKCHGEFVWLAKSEYEHLGELLGKDATDKWIVELNLYIGSKGDPYESHYYTIQVWARRAAEKKTKGEVKVMKDEKEINHGNTVPSVQRTADRFLEALKGRDTMGALDSDVRAAVYALMKKRNVNWPLLRHRVLADPQLEEKVREEFVALMRGSE